MTVIANFPISIMEIMSIMDIRDLTGIMEPDFEYGNFFRIFYLLYPILFDVYIYDFVSNEEKAYV